MLFLGKASVIFRLRLKWNQTKLANFLKQINKDTYDERGVHWEEGLQCLWVCAKLEFDVDRALEELKIVENIEKEKVNQMLFAKDLMSSQQIVYPENSELGF